MTSRRSVAIYAVLLLAISTMAGCAAMRVMEPGSQDALAASVQTIWDAKIKKDWTVVYDLLSKEMRASVKREDFGKQSTGIIVKYAIIGKEIIEPAKKTNVYMEFKLSQQGFNFTFDTCETWIWEDGSWRLSESKPITKHELINKGFKQ